MLKIDHSWSLTWPTSTYLYSLFVNLYISIVFVSCHIPPFLSPIFRTVGILWYLINYLSLGLFIYSVMWMRRKFRWTVKILKVGSKNFTNKHDLKNQPQKFQNEFENQLKKNKTWITLTMKYLEAKKTLSLFEIQIIL